MQYISDPSLWTSWHRTVSSTTADSVGSLPNCHFFLPFFLASRTPISLRYEHQGAKVLEFLLQSQSFQWIFRTPVNIQISFRMDWLDILAVQGTLKSLLQHCSSKASIFWHSAFLIVQLSNPYMTTGKTIECHTFKMSYFRKKDYFGLCISQFWLRILLWKRKKKRDVYLLENKSIIKKILLA